MTPKEAEAYTQARWEGVQWTMGPNPWTLRISCARYFDGTQDECWRAAAEFTRQREEEIRLKRQEIGWVMEVAPNYEIDSRISGRILAVLESQLAALLTGMRETP